MRINLANNAVTTSSSKHIDVHYHFFLECADNAESNVIHVPSAQKHADFLTKALLQRCSVYCISFELHSYYYRFMSRGRERFLPSARFLYRSFLQYLEYLDHPILRLSLPTMLPAGFLTSTANSCLG